MLLTVGWYQNLLPTMDCCHWLCVTSYMIKVNLTDESFMGQLGDYAQLLKHKIRFFAIVL